MRSFQRQLPAFHTRGIRVVAISTDESDVTKRHCQKLGFTFTFLSDPKLEAVDRYGLRHEDGGPGGAGIARPAEFLIDASGAVRWINLTESVTVRARPEQVLKAFDELPK